LLGRLLLLLLLLPLLVVLHDIRMGLRSLAVSGDEIGNDEGESDLEVVKLGHFPGDHLIELVDECQARPNKQCHFDGFPDHFVLTCNVHEHFATETTSSARSTTKEFLILFVYRHRFRHRLRHRFK